MNEPDEDPGFFAIYILLDDPKSWESSWKGFQQGNPS